ncbi:hypothetical protein TRVL_07275 [Trypanosoma vivax]|nr:hypothetical protein TRVL_07275 [Trypanosoma vivax]
MVCFLHSQSKPWEMELLPFVSKTFCNYHGRGSFWGRASACGRGKTQLAVLFVYTSLKPCSSRTLDLKRVVPIGCARIAHRYGHYAHMKWNTHVVGANTFSVEEVEGQYRTRQERIQSHEHCDSCTLTDEAQCNTLPVVGCRERASRSANSSPDGIESGSGRWRCAL